MDIKGVSTAATAALTIITAPVALTVATLMDLPALGKIALSCAKHKISPKTSDHMKTHFNKLQPKKTLVLAAVAKNIGKAVRLRDSVRSPLNAFFKA